MKAFRFLAVLQSDGWHPDQYILLNQDGTINSFSDTSPGDHIEVEHVNGYCVPGFQNAHSHAFQYAMAGLAEIHTDPSHDDDFWSWRETMYNIALSLGPEELEAIASMLYSEMLRNGYTSVAEFHYLHHNKNGTPYDNPSELGERLVSAAKNAGIKITLVPMFYQKGGFGKDALSKQRRFLSNSTDEYQKLLEASSNTVKKYTNASIGLGVHSLRAVGEHEIKELLNLNHGNLPIHIHIAEQKKEIDDCIVHYGQRPIQWLLNNINVNQNYHLVHATHIDDTEIVLIAKSKAHVVICPSTEGNLGDGIFPLKKFQNEGGKWSIGTDSHIGLNPLEELRLLDYGQRLTTHKRNNFVTKSDGNSGNYSFNMALKSGRRAMGNANEEYFKTSQPFDAVIIGENNPLVSVSKPNQILSTIIYSGDSSALLGTITNGEWVVKNSKHRNADEITRTFKKVMNRLKIR